MDEFVTLDSLSVSASDIYSNFSQLVLNLFHKKRIHLCFLLNCNSYYNIVRIFAKSNSIARACFISLLSTLMTSTNYTSSSFAKVFLSKRIFRRINSFRHLNMNFTIFLNVVFSDLSNFLSVSRQKHICEVKKYSHLDIDGRNALGARYNNKHLS